MEPIFDVLEGFQLRQIGAGTRLPAKRLRPDRLRAKVHEAIRLREGARRVQQAFAAAGGPSAAADAFETRLLAGQPEPDRPGQDAPLHDPA